MMSTRWMMNRGKYLFGGATVSLMTTYIGVQDRVTLCRGLSTASAMQLQDPVKLYQYNVCPYCNKVQAFLEHEGIPYSKVEVNPLTKKEMKFSEYKFVPFAIINGQQVNGSSEIIKMFLDDKKVSDNAKEWCQWVDDHLVHILPPNIYRTPGEAVESFNYITTNSNFSYAEGLMVRYSGAAIMYLIAKRSVKKYGLSDNVRQDLMNALTKWTLEGLSGREFHGGKEPDVADVTVYGVVRSIYGDNYTTWKDISTADFEGKKAFMAWFDKMHAIAAKNKKIVEN